jgi:recombination protein RecT
VKPPVETGKVQPQPKQPTQVQLLHKALGEDSIKRRFEEMLGKRAAAFTSSILSLVNSKKELADADAMSVVQACAQAAAFDLPINPNLSFAHIVPYWENKTRRLIAQFQMGWKGFVQLAQRSGLYKTMNATIFEFNPEAKSDLVEGYLFYFKLLNGFEKYVYLSRANAEKHAKRYSQSYKKGYGVWVDNFDAMALKTVVKEGLSKWGPLSVDIQKAIELDQAEVLDGEVVRYPDNQPEVLTAESSAAALAAHQDAAYTLPGVEPKATPKQFVERLKDVPGGEQILQARLKAYLDQKDNVAYGRLADAMGLDFTNPKPAGSVDLSPPKPEELEEAKQ